MPRHSGNSTAQLLVETLRGELRAARRREKELLKQLAEKDAQVRMILEEKFITHVVTGPVKPAAPKVDIATLPDMRDTATFSKEADAKQLKEEDDALDKATAALEAEFEAIEAEQARAHAEDGAPSAEDLDAVAEEKRTAEATA